MKFFFDARYIRTDYHDGLSRYSTELANAVSKLSSVTFIISEERQRQFLPKSADWIKIHPTTSSKEPFTSLILNKYHPDVVFTPLQSMGSLGRNFKLILNQQDMTYYKDTPPPNFLPFYARVAWWLYHRNYWPGRLTLNAADVVATVSETSKQEIIAARLTKRPIIVIPNAARDLSGYLSKKPRFVSGKNLVYMGAFLPHKNVETLVRAMEFLPNKTLHLLSRITDARKAELEKLIPPGASIVFHNGVTDEQYANLLANDAIAVTASKSEGYGLPIAEALQLGTPVVVSDIPVFHEVAGYGGLYADPKSPENFARKVKELENGKLHAKLSKAGKEHINNFSWSASANTLINTVTNLIK